MTDDIIKEIYLMAVYAKTNGQTKIPVYIFPFRMNDQNFDRFKMEYEYDADLIDFWTNLKGGYDKFAREKKELKVRVNEKGDYL